MKRCLPLSLLLVGCTQQPVPDAVEGDLFEVFAPFADAVSLEGDFAPAGLELVRDDAGVWSGRAETSPGDEYLVIIDAAGERLERQDPRSRQLTHSAGRSVIPDRAVEVRPLTLPAREDMVIYELHTGTFVDEPGGDPGTLTSALERLDHLEQLGVNVVELMPVNEYAGDYSWGYNPSFPFSVESSYGTPDELRAFIDACHAREIAVLLDVVHNHWGPSDLAMWCFDGECLGEDNGGAYFFTGARRESGWGPRPDYSRAPVRDLILDSVTYLLEDIGADGMRWDSTVNIRNAGSEPLHDGWTLLQEVNARFPDKLMIAEDLQRDADLTTALANDGAGFDLQWEGAFFHPVHDVLYATTDDERDLSALTFALEHDYNDDALSRVIYTESHDEVANGKARVPQMIDPEDPSSPRARGLAAIGATLVFTAPGVPMIFQGQELLEDEYFQDTDPLDWSKAERFPEVLELYRSLIALRRTHPGLKRAPVRITHQNDGAKVLAYTRGEDALIVLNLSATDFSGYTLGAPSAGAWSALWTGEGPDIVEAAEAPYDGLPAAITIPLPAYGAVTFTR